MECVGPSNIGTDKHDYGPTSASDSRRNINKINGTDDKSPSGMSHAQRDATEVLDSDARRWLERTGYYDQSRHDAIAEAWKQLDVFNEKAEKKLADLDRKRILEAAAIEEERTVLLQKVGILMDASPSPSSRPSSKRQALDDTCEERAGKRQRGHTPLATDSTRHVETPAGVAPFAFMRPDSAMIDETIAPANAAGSLNYSDSPPKLQTGTRQGLCPTSFDYIFACLLVLCSYLLNCLTGVILNRHWFFSC